jgi:hypothetical protein
VVVQLPGNVDKKRFPLLEMDSHALDISQGKVALRALELAIESL